MRPPAPRSNRPQIGILAAALLGLLLTAAAGGWGWNEERKNWQAAFDASTDETASILRLTLDNTLHVARGVGAYLREQPQLDQQAFERLVAATLQGHSEVEFIAFHPYVTAAEREALVARARSEGLEGFEIRERSNRQWLAAPARAEYFPITRIAPDLSRNAVALGFSPVQEGSPNWSQLQESRRSGRIFATERIAIFGRDRPQPGVAVWAPVFGERRQLIGFVTLGIRAVDIGTALFERSPIARDRLKAHVFDVTDPAKPTLLYSDALPAGDGAALLASELTPASLRVPPYSEHTLEIGGRNWLLLFRPTESFAGRFSLVQPLLVVAIGLAFTLLLVLYLRGLAARTASVERQVDERTRAWRQANEELLASLGEHKQTQQRLEQALGEREAALIAQRESEILFHTAFEHAAGPAALILPNGRFLETNAAFSRMIGFSRTDLSLMTMHELTHPADRQLTPTEVDKVLRGEQSGFRIEKRYIHKDGRIVWIEAQSAVVRDAQGRPRFFVAHVLDVTQSRHDQRQLKLLSRQQDWILNTSREAIIGLDARGCASFVNDAACEFLGYPREALLGATLHALVHHSHADGHPYAAKDCPIVAALAGRGPEPRRVRNEAFWRRDGSRVLADYVVTPMLEGGQVSGAVVVITAVAAAQRAAEDDAAVMAGF